MQQKFDDYIQQLTATYNGKLSFQDKQKLATKTFRACQEVSNNIPTELKKFMKRVVPRDTLGYDRKAVDILVKEPDNHGINNSRSYKLIQEHMGYEGQKIPIVLLYALLKLVPNRSSNCRVFKNQSAIYTELDRNYDWLKEYISNAEMGGNKIFQFD